MGMDGSHATYKEMAGIWNRRGKRKGQGHTVRDLGIHVLESQFFHKSTEFHWNIFHRWHGPTYVWGDQSGYHIEKSFKGTRLGWPLGIWIYESGAQGYDVTHDTVIKAHCRGLLQGECKQWEEQTAQAWGPERPRKVDGKLQQDGT